MFAYPGGPGGPCNIYNYKLLLYNYGWDIKIQINLSQLTGGPAGQLQSFGPGGP